MKRMQEGILACVFLRRRPQNGNLTSISLLFYRIFLGILLGKVVKREKTGILFIDFQENPNILFSFIFIRDITYVKEKTFLDQPRGLSTLFFALCLARKTIRNIH